MKISDRKEEKGAVFMELALILPFLALLIIGVSDFGLFLQSYFRATHIVREGVRTAVGVPRLEAKVLGVPTTFSGTYLITGSSSPVLSQTAGMTDNHADLQERIRKLLQVENNGVSHSMQLANDQVQIDTKCDALDNSVEVSLSATYAPLLPLQNILGTAAAFKYRVSATGNYLFSTCG